MLFLLFSLRVLMAQDITNLNWAVVNDTVMGGVSSSSITNNKKGFLFSGNVSKENNGGFASIRLRSEISMSGANGVQIHATGKELQYQIVVWMGYGPRLYYKYSFMPSNDVQDISFSDFVPVSYGREVNAPPLELQLPNVRSIGILIGDGQEGPFELQVHHFSTSENKNTEFNTEQKQLEPEIELSLQRAIQRGVPVYNQGEPQVCAAIYQTVLEDILLLKKSDLSEYQLQIITNVLNESSDLPSDKRAWAYRYVIDSLLQR